jgi:hypothetical protein
MKLTYEPFMACVHASHLSCICPLNTYSNSFECFAIVRSSTAKVIFCTPGTTLLYAIARACTHVNCMHLTMVFSWHLLIPAALASRCSSLTDALPREQAARIVLHTRINIFAACSSYCDASASPRRRNVLHSHRSPTVPNHINITPHTNVCWGMQVPAPTHHPPCEGCAIHRGIMTLTPGVGGAWRFTSGVPIPPMPCRTCGMLLHQSVIRI